MRTVYAFCILFLVFSGQALAQLRCTYCSVNPSGGASRGNGDASSVDIVAAGGGGTFTGSVVLHGHSVFSITGTGHYKIDGRIFSLLATTSLTLSAPSAGGWGGRYAGVTFTGDDHNSYLGPTIIKSGYIACKKTGSVVTTAIPRDIIFKPNSNAEAGLWFGANHQLNGFGKIKFDRSEGAANAIVSLNGTTQAVAGIEGNNEGDFVENIAPDNPTSIPGIPHNKTDKAVLIVKRTSGDITHYGSHGGNFGKLRSGTGNGGLEFRVEGTHQVFYTIADIKDFTVKTELNGILGLHTYGNRPDVNAMGGNMAFKGNGAIKKTGEATLSLEGITLSQSGGRIWVHQGVLRNKNNTIYPHDNDNRNKAVLQLSDGYPTFDLYGVNSFFGGLTGGGRVENNWKGFSTLVLEPNNEQIFTGQIKDNDANQRPVSETETGKGGVILRKAGNGTQVLGGSNFYTGSTVVAAGTLKLQGGGKLGNDGTYSGQLEISNSANPAAVFEHNGTEPQVFDGSIISYSVANASANPQRGILRQSGTGRTIINTINRNDNAFTGNVEITGGLLAGSGDLRRANSVTVGPQGAIGGGLGEFGGAILTVGNLTFAAATSKLLVFPRSNSVGAGPIPGTVEVKTSNGSLGTVSAPQGFTVEFEGRWVWSGCLLKCSNGRRDNLPLPTLGNPPITYRAYTFCFRWEDDGLYVTINPSGLTLNSPGDKTILSGQQQPEIVFTSDGGITGYQWRQVGDHRDDVGLADYTADWTRTSIPAFTAATTNVIRRRTIEVTGYRNYSSNSCMTTRRFTYTVEPIPYLTCDSCTFTSPGTTQPVTGTTTTPATIISGETGEFTGNIILNGACNFTLHNRGNFILSGQITGTGPLTYQANEAGGFGNLAGITLSGDGSNTYTGLTSVTKGYVICNKTNNAVAIPNDVKISAVSGSILAHVWCKANNQFGSSVVDLSGGQTWSFFHLNSTTQTIAGLKGNNTKGVVENWEEYYRAAPLANELPTGEGLLNIVVAAGNNSCIFGGGAQIRRGTTTHGLTVNVTGGTQIIQNPNGHINNVTLASTGGGTLEFATNTGSTYRMGNGILFKGDGNIRKTGDGVLALTNASVLKTGGQIWVHGGTLRNDGTTYSNATESNRATLRVEAGQEGTPPIFDLWGNNSIFVGLTGNGVVQNNFGSAETSPGGGFNNLFLKLTDSYTFAGVIRNNSASLAPESNGGEGKGGVVLKIEGNNQTQGLSGVNLYTGVTTIASGKLALTGNGQLSGGTYAGVLEIANVADAASQATFEHNGSSAQVFTGDITTTGEGATKGIFLQSGSGKSILTDTKAFTGNVNITNGFLGGTGSLGSVNSVNLEGTGSIGGGNGVAGNGGTFTSKGLTFKSENAKLRVTSKSDNTPSLLDVQSVPTAVHVNRFRVDILGDANLQGGRILKIPTGSPTGLPPPVIGENSTGKGVRLDWDNEGLRMQISHGTITLSLAAGLVCPKLGTNPGNSRITVTATYSDVRDLPPAEAVLNFFTLSDARAKSGEIAVSRSGSVMTAEFDGANPTNADLPYTITYDDHKNGVISLETHINRSPTLSVSSGGNPACVGTPLVLQGVSKDGTGTISSQNTNIATVGSATAALTATATILAVGNVDFLLTDSNGCKSEYLRVVLNGVPAITAANATLCAAVNGAGSTTTLTADRDPATASAWVISAATGASIEDVTHSDRQARFRVTNTAITEQKPFIVEYTDHLGCKGTTTITVNPNPTLLPASSTLCASVNNVANSIAFTASQDPAPASAWVISPANEGASVVDETANDRLARFRVTNTAITEQKSFTVEYTDQAGCKGTSSITVNPVPVVSARSGSGFNLAKLCAGAQYPEAFTVSETIAGNWAVYGTGTTIASSISTSVTSATAGRGNILAGNTTAATTIVEDVVFISNASCKSTALSITIHPKPVMNNIANKAYCRDTDISAFTPASVGTGEARPTHYQWYADASATHRDNINLADHIADWTKTAVSSFRTPGITTPIQRDITIKGYNSTSGCVSESQVFTLTVNSGLTLSYTSTSPICSGTDTYVFLSSSLSETNYTWTVSSNNLGAQSQTTASSSPAIKQRLTGSGNVTYTVRASSGPSSNCTATVAISIAVYNSQAATATATGGGNYCVNPDNATYQTNLSPSTSGTNAVWTYTSYFPAGQADGLISGNTQKWEKGTLTAVTDNLVLSGQAPASVYYVFRPFTNCLGSPSTPVSVRLHPAPAAPVVENSTVCSHSTAHPTTTNIVLSSTTADVRYTWMVDKANAPEVTGFSEPSRNGAVVPTNNPTAAISGPIADHLILAATATSAQTIAYRITPWYAGCPGQVVSTNVLVNPHPVVNKPADRLYCSGAEVVAELLTGTHGANSFKWSGGASAGLADQAVYGAGLPAYTAPASGQQVGPVEVKISAQNAMGCESSSEVSFTLSVKAKPSVTLGTSRALCTGLTVETAAATKIGVTPTATKYKWKARAQGASIDEIKIIQEGTARSFPLEETTLQEGDIVKKMTAPAGSVTIITFDVQPFLAECAGDEVSTTVQVNGRDLTGGIVNNSPGICSGSAANIKVGEAEDGNTYSWASLDNSGKVQGYNQQAERRAAVTISDVLTLTGNKQSNVTYTITPSRGDCDGALVSPTVFVNPRPVLMLSPSMAIICSGEKTTISLSTNLIEPESNAVTYSWAVSDNTGVQSSVANQPSFEQQRLVNQSTAESSVTYTFTPFYTLSAALSCEGLPGTSVYTVRPRIVASINDATTKACLGDEAITLRATVSEGATYQWLKDDLVIQGATGDSFVVTTGSESASLYAVKITNSSGCAVSDSRKVEVTEDAYFIGASAKMNPTVGEINKPVSFEYTGPTAEYSWDFNDNTGVVTTQNASHSYSNQGIFHPVLRVVKPNQADCQKTITLPVLKITPITGDHNGSGVFSVYPVPAQDRLTIVNDGGDLQNITIRDIGGKIVMSEAVNGSKATLSIAHFANGIYLLTITDSKGVKRMKISKN